MRITGHTPSAYVRLPRSPRNEQAFRDGAASEKEPVADSANTARPTALPQTGLPQASPAINSTETGGDGKGGNEPDVKTSAITGDEADSGADGDKESSTSSSTRDAAARAELSEEAKTQVRELQQRDREVRQHEQAHLAAAGGFARGGPSYTYQRGPDGRQYAVGGEVSVDTSPVPGDPRATIAKAQVLRRAALAPADPSGQDRAVAAAASQMEAKARRDLRESQRAQLDGADATSEDSADSESTRAVGDVRTAESDRRADADGAGSVETVRSASFEADHGHHVAGRRFDAVA